LLQHYHCSTHWAADNRAWPEGFGQKCRLNLVWHQSVRLTNRRLQSEYEQPVTQRLHHPTMQYSMRWYQMQWSCSSEYTREREFWTPCRQCSPVSAERLQSNVA